LVVLEELEQVRGNFLKYTREAFLLLPPLKKPRILDVGCGSGIPAMELAKLTDGEITGIDIDQSCINEFERKIEQEGLLYRVKTLRLSASEMSFSDETFDVIWSEGVIGEYSFERELKDWRKLLKRDGYLVIITK
jgi:2-polyprenyl-3-methyl-5-hydroxy-6-metoxy-1,4-benzoquinol methylase